MTTRILVTGGAGYVGSHCARRLDAAGYEVVTVDNLSQGHAAAASGELVVADICDRDAMAELLSRGFDAVLHFAARMSVGESVEDPIGYFDSNVAGTLSLLEAMRQHDCRRLVFSSTCAVYGPPSKIPVSEEHRFGPISPYGETKAVVERVLELAMAREQLQAIRLRYFNAAGASHDGLLGEAHDPECHLIPIALQAALSGRPMTVFGTDHPTRDGTCVRDYVHVEDLADVHLIALRRLLADKPGGAWNVGSGNGYTVREILDTISQVTGHPVATVDGPRRDGDPPALVCDTSRTRQDLGWSTQRGLQEIIEHAWQWHRSPRFGPRS
jgi:UDP-glucose-4-epimerase GalE